MTRETDRSEAVAALAEAGDLVWAWHRVTETPLAVPAGWTLAALRPEREEAGLLSAEQMVAMGCPPEAAWDIVKARAEAVAPAVRLDWRVWNEVPHPDGMTVLDPDGFRGGRPTIVTWAEFDAARMACTLVDRRDRAGWAVLRPESEEAGLRALVGDAIGLLRKFGHENSALALADALAGKPGVLSNRAALTAPRETDRSEAVAIIQDIALLTAGDDDSRPLLDDLPPELTDRITALLNRHGSEPTEEDAEPEREEAGLRAALERIEAIASDPSLTENAAFRGIREAARAALAAPVAEFDDWDPAADYPLRVRLQEEASHD